MHKRTVRCEDGGRRVGGCVGHAREHRALPVVVAEAVELHLVAADELAHLGYGEGLHPRVAGDEDGFEGLARRVLEHLVVEEGEVHADPARELGRADAAVLLGALYSRDYEIGLVHPSPCSEPTWLPASGMGTWTLEGS